MPSIQSLRDGYGLNNLTDDDIKSYAEKNGLDVWDDQEYQPAVPNSFLDSHPELIGIGIILVIAIWITAFRKMKSKQTLVIVSLITVIIGLFLFPPFQIQIKGTEINMGYALIFDPPMKGGNAASINVLLLITECFGAALVGGLLWVLARNKSGN